MRLASFLIVLVAAVPAAHADNVEAAAEQEFRLGYRSLQAGNCTDALVHYRRSLELVPRPRTLFNIATCEEDLGQNAAAWRDYQAFVAGAEARDAAIVIEARARLEALRSRVRGKLAVDSTPTGATVRVDGERQPRGETPVTLSLEPGRHVVKLSLPGAVDIERVVEIGPEEQNAVRIELAPPATIAIRTDPSDATIEPATDGGIAIGHLDLSVQPGHHMFVIQRDGYRTEHIDIDARPGRVHEIRVNLRPQPLVATLSITGADATVDGKQVDLRSIASGDHQIELSQRGRVVWRRGVQFSPGDIVSIRVPPPPSRTRRTVGWALGGFGAGSIVAGGVLGTLALRDVRDADLDVHDRGKTRALVADGMFVAGTAALVVAWRLLRTDHDVEIRRETAR